MSCEFFLLLLSDNSLLVEALLSIGQFLSGFESFFLGLNNFLGGNLFLDLALNSLDGVLNFSNEVLEVLDLFLNSLLLVGEEIMLLLSGHLGGEHLVLLLDVLLEGSSKGLDFFSDLINGSLSNDSSFRSWGLGGLFHAVSSKNIFL